ncbi:MAG: hypothetical protein ACLR2E_08880 [Lachnospiraceae bacterium]
MKKRLRVKFAVLYGLFALLSFIAVSTFTMSLTRKYETKRWRTAFIRMPAASPPPP